MLTRHLECPVPFLPALLEMCPSVENGRGPTLPIGENDVVFTE